MAGLRLILQRELCLLQIIWYSYGRVRTDLDLLGLALPLVYLTLSQNVNVRWVSYTSDMHGAIYIILKDSLKWIPIIGWGMQFYGFSKTHIASILR